MSLHNEGIGAPPRFQIMARSGPEDALQAVQLPTNSSAQFTAGRDWAIVRSSEVATSDLDYKSVKDTQRYTAMIEGQGPESRVLADLAKTRRVCSQPAFALEVCKRSYKAHQVKQCTPAYVEQLKCQIKLARAVDVLCRPSFTSLTQCLAKNNGDATKCIPEVTAFDVCTEDF